MEIITNHHYRQFKTHDEIPAKVLDKYEHLSFDEKLDGWIQYRQEFYHLSDFMDCHNSYAGNLEALNAGYDGYLADTFFSGIWIKLSDDCEEYKIARIYA